MSTKPSYNENELLAGMANGDETAFGRLFHLHHQALGDYIWKLTGSKEAAEEITQEAFVKAWQQLTLDFTVPAALAARNVRGTSVDRYSPITVDEMALYSTTLSPAQVAAHAAASAIPEPSTLALAGVAAMGLLRRRRHA